MVLFIKSKKLRAFSLMGVKLYETDSESRSLRVVLNQQVNKQKKVQTVRAFVSKQKANVAYHGTNKTSPTSLHPSHGVLTKIRSNRKPPGGGRDQNVCVRLEALWTENEMWFYIYHYDTERVRMAGSYFTSGLQDPRVSAAKDRPDDTEFLRIQIRSGDVLFWRSKHQLVKRKACGQ